MAKQTFIIDSMWGGIAPSQYFKRQAQYLAGIGIDPDLSITDAVGDRQTAGQLRPSGYADFSGANVNANVIAIITNPKDALIYAVLANGRLISYTSTFGTETLVGTATGDNAEGAFYYNNYIYILGTGASKDDISRYGPLNNSPTLVNNVWKGSTLGTQTALGDETYPSIRGSGSYPSHWGHVHTDDRAYFCDFTAGIGYIHFIKTTKTTDEGDTNDGSQYAKLDLPFGFMPTDIESWGNDIVISAIQTSNSTLKQGRSALFFWDGSADTFYNMMWLPDPIVTALRNNNGILYIWSGAVSTGTDVSNGYRFSRYIGGQSIEQLWYSEKGCPPMAGAVEASGNRIIWGTFDQIPTTTAASPEYYGVVMAYGSKRHDVPQGVHGIAKMSSAATAADGIVTALKDVQQSSFAYPKYAVAWRNASDFGIDSQSTTYGTNVFRSEMFNIGMKFLITRIRIPLGAAVAANMTITPKIFTDDFIASSTNGLTVINSTNYANSQRVAEMFPGIAGENNFSLELRFTGTVLLPVLFPIEIEIEDYTA